MVGSGGTKRKSHALDTDSDSDGSGSASNLDKEMLFLSKKKKAAPVPKKPKELSDSESSDSDSDWASKSKTKKLKKKKPAIKRGSISHSHSASGSDGHEDDEKSDNDFSSLPTSTTTDVQSKQPTTAVNQDLEEGEVSSSESGDESSGSEFDDGYDENHMGDEEDKQRLNAMTEKEREQEIFKRVEQREAMKTRYDIEKKLRQAKKRELKKQKKAEGITSKFKMDAKERSKERKKTVEAKVDKKSQAMDLLKAKREAKKEREEEKEKARIEQEKIRELLGDDEEEKDEISSTITERSKKKLKASDIYSDDSGSEWETSSNVKVKRERDESSSSSDSDSEPESHHRRKPVPISNIKDLNRLRLSRYKIEKWIHYPFFENLAKGMFVRLGIGHNPKEQKAVYRIAEVVEVVETPKIYTLGNTRTNKAFKLRHGSDEKIFRLEFVSSQEFVQDEFDKWLQTCEEKNIALPTLDDADKKEKDLREANNYQFKESDVEHIIQEKQRFKQSPVNFAVKKTQLLKEKETAQQRGDDSRVEEITREIADLDERAKELDKARSQSIQSISYINERNRKKNVEQAEKAIMAEIKESRGKKIHDPFTRRNTKPMPMVVNRTAAGGTPGQMSPSPRTPDNALLKSDPDQPEFLIDITVGDIRNEDLLRQNDDNEEGENVLPEVSSISPNTTPRGKSTLNIIPLEKLDLTSSVTIDLVDGKPPKALSTCDLFSAHDFDIQLELDAKLPPNLPIVARPSIPQVREPAPKRSLNLEDYKRKRGLI